MSQLSQLSQGPGAQILRAHLLALAEQMGIDVDLVHRLPDADVKACAGVDDETLRRWLHKKAAVAALVAASEIKKRTDQMQHQITTS